MPLSGQPGVTVEEQRADPGSMLGLCRDLIALRRSEPDLSGGGYEARPAPDGLWAYRRGSRFVVALNLSDRIAPDSLALGQGVALVCLVAVLAGWHAGIRRAQTSHTFSPYFPISFSSCSLLDARTKAF